MGQKAPTSRGCRRGFVPSSRGRSRRPIHEPCVSVGEEQPGPTHSHARSRERNIHVLAHSKGKASRFSIELTSWLTAHHCQTVGWKHCETNIQMYGPYRDSSIDGRVNHESKVFELGTEWKDRYHIQFQTAACSSAFVRFTQGTALRHHATPC